MKRLFFAPLLASLFALGACATQIETDGTGGSTVSSTATSTTTASTTATSSSSSGEGGSGGSSACGQDCSKVQAPDCYVSVCNEDTGVCEIEMAEDDSPCEDGLYCTIEDTCQGGLCESGPDRICEGSPDECLLLVCDEDRDACVGGPVPNGSPCTSPVLCEANAICQNGVCQGAPLDCSGTVVDDCLYPICNPQNGLCEGVADPSQDGTVCTVGGDPCMVAKTCDAGSCQGGVPKDCSMLDVGCQNGVCNVITGACEGIAVPVGGQCNSGTDDCNTGICNAAQQCVLSPVPNGTTCDDFSTCSTGDTCTNGTCGGTLDPFCTVYLEANFEQCPPPGWALSGEWQCGIPTSVGPPAAFEGANVIGTVLAGNYSNSQTYEVNWAQTPPIGLGTADEPILSFRHWVDTEGNTYDAYNVKVSTDNGLTWSVITDVNPPYNLTVAGQPGWGGHQQALGWQLVTVNLLPYAGQQIMLRFSFRTDGSVVYPDVQVGEAVNVPLDITTTSISNALAGLPYSDGVAKTGGTTGAQWSIVGGTNIGWLSIDANTGALSGTPAMANLGPGTVTVRVEEPLLPTNFDEETFTFTVQEGLYQQTFEGACPNGWTMAGSWGCGVPTGGPGSAYGGTQAIACVLSGDYPNGLAYATNHATSGLIDLTGTTAPQLTFWTWYDTESCCDGFNVKVSTDGVTYTLVTAVTPAYNTTIASEQAWSGLSPGWLQRTVDLSAYANSQIYLRVAFRTDGSVVNPGVFIDNLQIAD